MVIAKRKQQTKKPPAKKPAKKPTKAERSGSATGSDAVRDALESGSGTAALTAALAWWSETRSPAVADLVDDISKRVSPAAVADDKAFAKLARAKNPLDLGALLPAIPQLPVSFLPTAAELLAGFPADPRIARAVAEWALDPVATSSSAYSFWTKMLDAVVRARDVRVVPVLQKRLKRPQEASKFWPRFYAALGRVVATLKEEKPTIVVPAAALAKRISKLSPIDAGGGAVVAPVVVTERAPKLAGSLLAQAYAHLTAGRTGAAIDAMLVRWRETRSPELADIIDRATRLLPSYDLPVPAEDLETAWLAAFERDPMAAMPQLLQHINVGSAKLAERRLVELGNLPDDPRIALRLAALVTVWGVSPQRAQYWKSLLQQLARIADVRTCEPLRVAFSNFTGTYYDHHRQAKRIIAPFVTKPPVVAPLPVADRALVEQLDAAITAAAASSAERGLVRAIAAAWDEDGPRQVYADWLIERGHPRGELILLECKRGRTAAEDQRRSELRAWPFIYGSLDELATIADTSCTRGLPHRLDVNWGAGTLNWRAAAVHPLAALVETIDVAEVQRPPTVEDLNAMLGAGTRLRAIERIEQDAEKTLWSVVDGASPEFRRTRGDFVRVAASKR